MISSSRTRRHNSAISPTTTAATHDLPAQGNPPSLHPNRVRQDHSPSRKSGGCQQNGTFLWPVIKARHAENLRLVLDEPEHWQREMLAELAAPRFDGAWVRLHDSGDFFSGDYLGRWLEIICARLRAGFYCYTKEVGLFREHVEPDPPANFWWVYSLAYLPSVTSCSPNAVQRPGRRSEPPPSGCPNGFSPGLHYSSHETCRIRTTRTVIPHCQDVDQIAHCIGMT